MIKNECFNLVICLWKNIISVIILLLIVLKVNAQSIESIYGSGGNDEFTSILKISDGGYIVSGSVSLDNGFGGKDIYVLRLDSNYEVIWSKIYGGLFDDVAYVSLINYNGNILLGCSSYSQNIGSNSDIVIIEIDLLGNVQWNKSFKTTSYDEVPRKIIKSPNGLTICAISNFVGTTSSPDMLVFEVDSNCNNIFWQNLIGSTDYSGDIPSSIITSNLGGFIMVGGTKTAATNYDQVIIRLTSNGMVESNVAFGSHENENTQDVIELSNNDLVLLGNFRNVSGTGLEMAFISMKSDYTFNWIKTYGDFGNKDDRPYVFKKTLKDEYVLVGYSYTYGSGDKDLMILKTDKNGLLISAYNYGGSGEEQPFDLQLNDDYAVIVGSSSSNSFGMTDCYMLREPVGELNADNCFNVNVFEKEVDLPKHSFIYLENNPNLIIESQGFNAQNVVLSNKNITYNKLIKGVINSSLSNTSYLDIAQIEVSSLSHLNEVSGTKKINSDDSVFYLSINSDEKLLINSKINDVSSKSLMKYRNGFDTYQIENIVTNQTNNSLQMEPSALSMIAADVDISDKIRSNDISLLQQRIVKKIDMFPQELPAYLQQDYIDFRFVDRKRIEIDESFKKGNFYPYYSSNGYCRDNVPDIPFTLINQGSCDSTYIERYYPILLGDLIYGGAGINIEDFNNHSSYVTLEIDDVNNVSEDTYRVFLKHRLNTQDEFVSLDFSLDYDESIVSISNTQTVLDNKIISQSLWNNYNNKELLFTSYSMNGYPLVGSLLYFDIQKTLGVPKIEDLGQLSVFVNGLEIPSSICLRSQNYTGIHISEKNDMLINIYPNPSDGYIKIVLPLLYAKDVHVEVLNIVGQIVFEAKNNQECSEIEIDLSKLAAGVYECFISIAGKTSVIKKVVIQ